MDDGLDFNRRLQLIIPVQALVQGRHSFFLWEALGTVSKSGKVPLLTMTVNQQTINNNNRDQHPFSTCSVGSRRVCYVCTSDHPLTVLKLNVHKSELDKAVKPDEREGNQLSDHGTCVLHSTVVLNSKLFTRYLWCPGLWITHSAGVVVWMKCLLQYRAFESLVPIWWHCVGRLRSYGLPGGRMPQEAYFESLETHVILSLLSLKMWALSCCSSHQACCLSPVSIIIDSNLPEP